ncbi:MAG: MarR family winged helix-turn-helix transcriptional regulator [Clostridia bacterium]
MNFITYKNLIDKYNRNIDSAIQEELRPYCYKHKITYLQYQILAVLFEEGALTIGDLSEKMSMDTGNMSAQCKRLEQKGYTLRLRKKFDERVVDVSLTRNGRLVITELNDILNKRYKTRWNELPEEDKENLIKSYEIMEKLFSKK